MSFSHTWSENILAHESRSKDVFLHLTWTWNSLPTNRLSVSRGSALPICGKRNPKDGRTRALEGRGSCSHCQQDSQPLHGNMSWGHHSGKLRLVILDNITCILSHFLDHSTRFAVFVICHFYISTFYSWLVGFNMCADSYVAFLSLQEGHSTVPEAQSVYTWHWCWVPALWDQARASGYFSQAVLPKFSCVRMASTNHHLN